MTKKRWDLFIATYFSSIVCSSLSFSIMRLHKHCLLMPTASIWGTLHACREDHNITYHNHRHRLDKQDACQDFLENCRLPGFFAWTLHMTHKFQQVGHWLLSSYRTCVLSNGYFVPNWSEDLLHGSFIRCRLRYKILAQSKFLHKPRQQRHEWALENPASKLRAHLFQNLFPSFLIQVCIDEEQHTDEIIERSHDHPVDHLNNLKNG